MRALVHARNTNISSSQETALAPVQTRLQLREGGLRHVVCACEWGRGAESVPSVQLMKFGGDFSVCDFILKAYSNATFLRKVTERVGVAVVTIARAHFNSPSARALFTNLLVPPPPPTQLGVTMDNGSPMLSDATRSLTLLLHGKLSARFQYRVAAGLVWVCASAGEILTAFVNSPWPVSSQAESSVVCKRPFYSSCSTLENFQAQALRYRSV